MKPLSQEAVKRLALAHGAKLTVDGKNINSARLKVVAAPKPKESAAYMQPESAPPEPKTIEAKPDPAVREALLSIDNYAASQFLLNEDNARMMAAVKDLIQKSSAKVEPEKRPTKWVFSIKRDAQGLMETITAKAINE